MDESTPKSRGDVTRLLGSWRRGSSAALDELLPLVYDELRVLAGHYMRRERSDHTLQPTALVHECFVRLTGGDEIVAADRSHFFAIAARAMRRILVDHARRQRAAKRPDQRERLAFDEVPDPAVDAGVDVLLLHDALERLAEIHPRQARLVELRYFGGLTHPEAAEVLDISLATAERDWQVARLWLRRRLGA